MKGKIIQSLSGFYDVESEHIIYRCKASGKFRKAQFKPVVGDECEFQIENETQGYITQIYPRLNYLIRPPVANIDQAILVFSSKEPDMNTLLLDRFLLEIESRNIEPVIVISKIDLENKEIYNTMQPYIDSGYKVIFTSSVSHTGIEEIKALFKDKVTVITGQSGVGKSSLLNTLDISLNIETGEISKVLGRGKHTTRHTQLLKMYGGYVADTPGFSSMELLLTPRVLAVTYHDFKELSVNCKFRGCLHDHEPECAVKQAVEDKKISKERYEHYLMFLKESKEKEDRKYD